MSGKLEKTRDHIIESFSEWRVWIGLRKMLDNEFTLTSVTNIGPGFRARIRVYERM